MKFATGLDIYADIKAQFFGSLGSMERGDPNATPEVSEVAYQLGFEHPQSFSRFFKARTKLSPLDFRRSFS